MATKVLQTQQLKLRVISLHLVVSLHVSQPEASGPASVHGWAFYSRSKDIRKRPIASKRETTQTNNQQDFSTKHLLQDALLVKELSQIVGVELILVWHHLQDAGQVGKQIPLVPICENRRDAGIIELDVLEVDLDKVDGRVGADEGDQSRLNGC